MEMTPEQIVTEYRTAKDQKAQVQILAELNQCSKDTILEILKDAGELNGYQLGAMKRRKKEAGEMPSGTVPPEIIEVLREAFMSEEMREQYEAAKAIVRKYETAVHWLKQFPE